MGTDSEQDAFSQIAVALVEAIDRQRREICDVIRAGVAAIEEIEKLHERHDVPALMNYERAANAHIHLKVGSAAKFVESGLHTIDYGAVVQSIAETIYINRSDERKWPRGFPPGPAERPGCHLERSKCRQERICGARLPPRGHNRPWQTG